MSVDSKDYKVDTVRWAKKYMKQHMRWENDIRKLRGARWKRAARDRIKWKIPEKTFVSGGHNDESLTFSKCSNWTYH